MKMCREPGEEQAEAKEDRKRGREGGAEDSTWTTMNEMTASTGGRTPGQAVGRRGAGISVRKATNGRGSRGWRGYL